MLFDLFECECYCDWLSIYRLSIQTAGTKCCSEQNSMLLHGSFLLNPFEPSLESVCGLDLTRENSMLLLDWRF